MEKRRWRRFCFLVLPSAALFLLFYLGQIRDRLRTSPFRSHLASSSSHLAGVSKMNATLGFGVVLAVSKLDSPRRDGLLWAANLTRLDITIAEQPEWTEEDLQKFRPENGGRATKGSVMAWLGHLHSLKWFLSTSHQTALILEDDVDWDILLQSSQIPLAAAAFHSLISPNTTSSSFLAFSPPKLNYWSPLSEWELIWLGHCGDAATTSHVHSYPHLTYKDPTVPPHDFLEPTTATQLSSLNVPEKARILHRSYWPLCTFAYAVTRASAQRILDEFGTEGEGGAVAYDVRLLEACRDRGWTCYTLAPELFHHIDAPSEIQTVDTGAGDSTMPVAQKQIQGTSNIGCGARHPDLWFEDQDGNTRKWLMGRVQKGECLIDSVAEDLRTFS